MSLSSSPRGIIDVGSFVFSSRSRTCSSIGSALSSGFSMTRITSLFSLTIMPVSVLPDFISKE